MDPPLPPPEHRRGRREKMLIGLVTAVAVAGLAVVAAVLFGPVQGEEFCPQTFTRRSFHYLQLPLFHVQLMPVRHADTTTPLERRFVTDRYVVPDPADPPRWDLVYSFRAGGGPVRGDAAILSTALDACDAEGQSPWNTWTDAPSGTGQGALASHRPAGPPGAVQFHAGVVVPARGAADALRLRQDLAAALARNYTQLTAIRQRLGEHTEALKLLGRSPGLRAPRRPVRASARRVAAGARTPGRIAARDAITPTGRIPGGPMIRHAVQTPLYPRLFMLPGMGRHTIVAGVRQNAGRNPSAFLANAATGP